MKLKILPLLFLILMPTLVPTMTWASDLPMPEIETLPNGMQLIWFVSDRLPIVDLDLIIKAGTRDDLPGKSGTAELIAATLDRGAGGLNAQEIAQAVESLGASRGASVDDDFFRIATHSLAADAPTLLGLLSKMTLSPTFAEDEIEREKSRMIDSYSRLAEYGESLVDLAYRRAMTLGTPYGRGSFLSIKEFSKIKRSDVIKYYRRNFVPMNSYLLIVGRVDKKPFREQIIKLFGAWQGAAPKRAHSVFSCLPGLKAGKLAHGEILLINRPDLTQAQVRLGFKAPPAQDPRHYALSVGNALLGEYFHSRLNTLIRDQLGLTYGISSAFTYDRDLSTLTITSATRNDAVGLLIEKTLGVLKGLKQGPLPDEEVKTAKDYLVGGFPVENATLESIANRWMTDYLLGLGTHRMNEYIPNISKVDTEEVLSAMSGAIDLAQITIAVAGDAQVIGPVLKKSGYKFRELPVKALLNGY